MECHGICFVTARVPKDKIISPLILISGAFLFRKRYGTRGYVLIRSIGVLIALPAVLASVSPEGMLRFAERALFL